MKTLILAGGRGKRLEAQSAERNKCMLEFAGKPLEMSLLHRPTGLRAKRLLVLGGGKARSFSAAELRTAAAAAVRFLKSKGVRSAALALDAGDSLDGLITAAAEGAKGVGAGGQQQRQRQEGAAPDSRSRQTGASATGHQIGDVKQ